MHLSPFMPYIYIYIYVNMIGGRRSFSGGHATLNPSVVFAAAPCPPLGPAAGDPSTNPLAGRAVTVQRLIALLGTLLCFKH